MPICSTSDLCSETGICQRMIKVSGLSIKCIGVCKWTVVIKDQVGEVIACSGGVIGTSFNCRDGSFLGIRVEVTHNQEVGVATSGWVCCQPIDQCLCG